MLKQHYKTLLILGILNICCFIIIFYFLSNLNAYSFEVAYFSSLFVFISSYIKTQNKIKLESTSLENEKSNQKTYDISKFALGVGLSFSLYRIISYIFLIASVIVLIELESFKIIGYFLGVVLSTASLSFFVYKARI